MIGIQIVAILFAVFMFYFSYLHFRRGEFKKSEFIGWGIIWIGLVTVVVYPDSVKFVLETFSITRTFDLVVIAGIVVVFAITFRNYVIIRRMERRIEEYTRQESLKNIERKP